MALYGPIWNANDFLFIIHRYLFIFNNYQKLTKFKKKKNQKISKISQVSSQDGSIWNENFFFQNLSKTIYFQELSKIKKIFKKKNFQKK